MNQKSIKWNVILNIIRMSLSIIFPLITFPYAFRILGAKTLGMVNYSLTYVNYASLIAALGITNYASREGAKIRDDKTKINIFTKQIFSINLLTMLMAYLVLFAIIMVIPSLHTYSKLILIQSVSILFSTLSVEWLNIIYEDYLYTTIRGLIINIITVVLLFVFVKSPDDYYIYAGLTVISNAVISVANYFHCMKYVEIGITKDINLKQHFYPIIVFFANTLAISIYVNSDSTMLGWIVGDYNVGIYTAAVKVYSMFKTILAAMYGVTISRMSYYLSSGEEEQYYNLCRKVICGLTTLLIPGSVALIFFSKSIILILSGSKYIEATKALQILCIGLAFAIFGGFITSCVNIPNGREKINMISAFISAGVNIFLNVFLIPVFYQNGAAFTTVIAELIVFSLCLFKSWDLIKRIINKSLYKSFLDGLIGGVIVIISFYSTNSIIDSSIIHFICNIFIVLIIYGIYLYKSGNELISLYFSSIIKFVKFRKR